MKKGLKFLFCACLMIFHQFLVNSQPLATCSDLQVSAGVFTPAWEGLYGKYTEYNNPCGINYSNNVTQGITDVRQRIRTLADGMVPCYGDNLVPFVPPGYEYSIQLGNNDDGREWERLETTFNVTDENSLIEINLALFFEDDGHPVCKQPRFWVKVFNENNEIIPCGDYLVIAAGNLPGWQTSLCPGLSPIRYLPWTKMSIDLRDYEGQNITLQFQSMDCSEGGHFGFGIFAIRCLSSQITSSLFCANDSEITLSAPDGFAGYVWSTGATTNSITVTNPVVGQNYSVTLAPFSNLNGNCNVQMDYTIPPAIALNMPSDTFFCEGTGINLEASTSNNSFNFEWNNGNTSNSIFVDAAGTYSVTATHADGCTLQGVVAVSENQNPQYQIDIANPICNGEDGQVIISPIASGANYSYLWPNSQVGAIQNMAAGSYSVTVTDVNTGCTSSDTIHITEPLAISILGNQVVYKCAEDSILLSVDAVGDIEFEWSNNSQGKNLKVIQPGLYTVTATDTDGCTASKTVEVSNYTSPDSTIEGDTLICAGTLTMLATSQNSNYTYNWSNNATTSSISVPNGTYSVTVTDQNDCTSIDYFSISEISLIELNINGIERQCKGDSNTIVVVFNQTNLNGSVMLSCSDGTKFTSPIIQNKAEWIMFPTESKIVSIDSVIVEGYPCAFIGLSSSFNIIVEDLQVQANPQLLINGYPTLCNDSTASIKLTIQNGTPPFSYIWSNGGTTSSLNNLNSGLYSVTITSSIGCTAEAETSIVATPVLAVGINASAPKCYGIKDGMISLSALSSQGAVRFRLNGVGGTLPFTLNNLGSGIYYLEMMDDYCTWDTTIVFPKLAPVNVGIDTTDVTILQGDNFTIPTISNVPIKEFEWSPTQNMTNPSSLQPLVDPKSDVWYYFYVITDDGCSYLDSIFIKVKNEPQIYIPNTFSPQDGSGGNDRFIIGAKPNTVEKFSIKIIDRWGALIFKNHNFAPNDYSSSWDGSVRGKPGNPGVYIYNLEVEFLDGTHINMAGDITLIR